MTTFTYCSPCLTDEQIGQVLAAVDLVVAAIKELAEAMVAVLKPAFEAIARAIGQYLRLLILSCRREDFFLWLYDRAPSFVRRWMLRRSTLVDRLLRRLPAWVVMRLPSDGGTRCH